MNLPSCLSVCRKPRVVGATKAHVSAIPPMPAARNKHVKVLAHT